MINCQPAQAVGEPKHPEGGHGEGEEHRGCAPISPAATSNECRSADL
jgi:hypothetical protein